MNLFAIERLRLTPSFRILRCLALLLGAAGSGWLGGCATTQEAASPSVDEARWLTPSPALRQRIEDQAKRLPWTHGAERIESIRWFASVGEPAYPTLLAMALDPRRDVAGSALAALGATRDSRLVEELHKLTWPNSTQESDLELERARTLVRLGDWSMLPVLVRGLRSEELMTRALCHQALTEATHEQFEFDPKGDPAAREVAVKRWEAWWAAHSQDPMLQDRK